MPGRVKIQGDVAAALAEGRPVVALESSVIAQGLPYPKNLEAAVSCERLLRQAGVTPATTAVLDGQLMVGLNGPEIERLASDTTIGKASRRDLAALTATGASGGTTVAATMVAATRAGIRVLATGGIGGVHRGGEHSLDISADLIELARSPVAVVAAGAKSILDLPRTLELLETQGVPVIGYGCDDFPAFYARSSGLKVPARVENAAQAAAALQAHWGLGLTGGLLIANPIPEAAAIDPAELDAWVDSALAASVLARIRGKAVTPFLLEQLVALSNGRSLAANIALLEHNARVAGEIATAFAAMG